jgi:uncharacterized protein YgiM (DUF1202 family)
MSPVLAERLETHSENDGYLNLRTGPSTSNTIIRELKNGTVVNTIRTQGDWAKVRLSNGSEGWAHRGYMVLPETYRNHQFFPRNECALQVASRRTMTEVREFVSRQIGNKPHLTIYQANNGLYAISVGTLRRHEQDSVIAAWAANGEIPPDSLCASGNSYVREVALNSSQNTQPARSNSTQTKTINCQQINIRDEVAACYALAVGPKACTQAISEARVPGNDTYFDRVALSSVCSSAVSSSAAKEFISPNLPMIAFEEFIESGCENLNSDSLLKQVFIGLPFCIANLKIWEDRLNLAGRCEREIMRQCG